MGALSGLYQLDGQPAAPAALGAMMQALSAFGPDGSRCAHAGPVVFGHHQRWVTPTCKHDVLPRHDANLGLTLTAVARLDNREVLRHTLGLASSEHKPLLDSHLILHAYAKWGTACPDHLLGDFAFAIWDARQQQLFCARDIFGVMPFFYRHSATQFWFASTLEAVCATSEFPHEIDYGQIAAYYRTAGNAPYTERTWYTGVHRLMPAHAMTVSASGVRIWPYWQPEQVPALPADSDLGYIEQLTDLLQRAVACRTRSSYPVGVHLSGGLDSSAVTALAARQTPRQGLSCTAFSWSPPPQGPLDHDDERTLVEAVKAAEGLACHYAPGTVYDVAETRLRPLHLPERRYVPESQVRRLAQDQGIRVMLSGWGGDELAAFNGRGYLADLGRRGQWRTLWRESVAYAQRRGRRTDQVLRGKVILPHLPDGLLPFVMRSAWPPSFKPSTGFKVPALLHPDMAAQLVAADAGLPQQMRRERPGVKRNQLDLLAHGHLTSRAEWWSTEAPENGVIYRYPMLDRRLAEFSLGLPPNLYFHDGWGRYILRRALEGIVPPRVQWNTSKAERVRMAYRQKLEAIWQQQVLRPLVADVLSTSTHFHSLDRPRIHELVQLASSAQETVRLPRPLAMALRVELMANPPLATDVQNWLYDRRQRYNDAGQNEERHALAKGRQ